MWLRFPRPQQKLHNPGLCDMCLQHQSPLDSRMACYSLLGSSCLMYAVICNASTCCTMLVCPGRHLLCVNCTLLLCQLWYPLMAETSVLSVALEAMGNQLWMLWFTSSPTYVHCWTVPTFLQCSILFVETKNFMAWNCHQGVGSVDFSITKLIINE